MNDPWHVDSENYRAAYYETIEKAKTELPSPLLAKLSNSGGSRIAGVTLPVTQGSTVGRHRKAMHRPLRERPKGGLCALCARNHACYRGEVGCLTVRRQDF
jgi:hypothetical protein